MQIPVQIVFCDLPRSLAVEQLVRERANKLEQFHSRITSCRVTVVLATKHQHQGKLFNVRVDLTVPGSEIVADRDHAEDIYVAIRDAFDAARRKLEDHARRARGDVKAHVPEVRGTITRLFPDEGYGLIRTADGDVVYFHRVAVVHPDFDRLAVGDTVTFLEGMAAEGRQANRVAVVRPAASAALPTTDQADGSSSSSP